MASILNWLIEEKFFLQRHPKNDPEMPLELSIMFSKHLKGIFLFKVSPICSHEVPNISPSFPLDAPKIPLTYPHDVLWLCPRDVTKTVLKLWSRCQQDIPKISLRSPQDILQIFPKMSPGCPKDDFRKRSNFCNYLCYFQ